MNECPVCGSSVAWELPTNIIRDLDEDRIVVTNATCVCQYCDYEKVHTVYITLSPDEELESLNECEDCYGQIVWDLDSTLINKLDDIGSTERSVIGFCQGCDREYLGLATILIEDE